MSPEIRGVADVKATEIYPKAYNQSAEAVAFYEFTRTMQSYKSIKGMTPDGDGK